MLSRNKPCKICGKNKKWANTNFCYICYRKRESDKKAEKEQSKKERHENTKVFKENLRKKLHAKAWILMSEYIRKKDADRFGMVACYTCGSVKHFREMNAGHYKHDRLDFDERNLKPQCVFCNQHNSGKLDVYAERLIKENGMEWFNDLVSDAWAHQGYSVQDLAVIIDNLKNKLDLIKQEKGY